MFCCDPQAAARFAAEGVPLLLSLLWRAGTNLPDARRLALRGWRVQGALAQAGVVAAAAAALNRLTAGPEGPQQLQVTFALEMIRFFCVTKL